MAKPRRSKKPKLSRRHDAPYHFVLSMLDVSQSDFIGRAFSGLLTGLAIVAANSWLDRLRRKALERDISRLVVFTLDGNINSSLSFLNNVSKSREYPPEAQESSRLTIKDICENYRRELEDNPFSSQVTEGIKVFEGETFESLIVYIQQANFLLRRLLRFDSWLKTTEMTLSSPHIIFEQSKLENNVRLVFLLSIYMKAKLAKISFSEAQGYVEEYSMIDIDFSAKDEMESRTFNSLFQYEENREIIETYLRPLFLKAYKWLIFTSTSFDYPDKSAMSRIRSSQIGRAHV